MAFGLSERAVMAVERAVLEAVERAAMGVVEWEARAAGRPVRAAGKKVRAAKWVVSSVERAVAMVERKVRGERGDENDNGKECCGREGGRDGCCTDWQKHLRRQQRQQSGCCRE